MSAAIDIAAARIETPLGEGYMQYPYNDANDQRVTCLPGGNLTWLYGTNLETEGCPELGDVIVRWKLGKIEAALAALPWYQPLDAPRASVFLELAYNCGLHGLLGFPSMIHYTYIKDWSNAAAQLLDSDVARKRLARWTPLAAILAGTSPPPPQVPVPTGH